MKDLPKQSRSQLQGIMQGRHEAVIRDLPNYPSIEVAKPTGWILATPRKKRLALEFFHSQSGFNPVEIDVGDPISLLPWDAGMDKMEPLLREVADALRPPTNAKQLDKSLEYHFDVVCRFMRKARVKSRILGPQIHCGYITETGEAEVLDLCPL
jgi:hypothetical protein